MSKLFKPKDGVLASSTRHEPDKKTYRTVAATINYPLIPQTKKATRFFGWFSFISRSVGENMSELVLILDWDFGSRKLLCVFFRSFAAKKLRDDVISKARKAFEKGKGKAYSPSNSILNDKIARMVEERQLYRPYEFDF